MSYKILGRRNGDKLMKAVVLLPGMLWFKKQFLKPSSFPWDRGFILFLERTAFRVFR